ncbi:MAG: GFA family protein [Caulobacter sp.]|nr:GFA family protein [Caulobacter sp.]
MTRTLTGGCLCGAVRYQAAAEPQMVGDCYCVDCRRSSGTTHCTHAVFVAEAVKVSGAVSRYERAADSGNLVTRAFCPRCGSAVYSTNAAMPGMIFIRASSLDDLEAVAPGMTVYASRAPSWARLNTDGPVFQEMVEGGPQSVLQGD